MSETAIYVYDRGTEVMADYRYAVAVVRPGELVEYMAYCPREDIANAIRAFFGIAAISGSGIFRS